MVGRRFNWDRVALEARMAHPNETLRVERLPTDGTAKRGRKSKKTTVTKDPKSGVEEFIARRQRIRTVRKGLKKAAEDSSRRAHPGPVGRSRKTQRRRGR